MKEIMERYIIRPKWLGVLCCPCPPLLLDATPPGTRVTSPSRQQQWQRGPSERARSIRTGWKSISRFPRSAHLDTWVYIMPLLTSIWPWSYHKYNLAKFQRDNSPQSHCEVTLSLYLDIFVRKSDTQSNLGRTTSLDLGHFWKISHPLSNPNQPQVSS